MNKTKKIPKSVMAFDSQEMNVTFNETEEPMLSMVGYSGGIIDNHYFWGNLAFDLQGIKFDKAKYPILLDHDTDKKIGYMGKPIVSEDRGLVVDPNTVKFLDNEHAKEFIKNSKAGFPYQSSVYMTPTKLEEVMQGTTSNVNGKELKGEGTVWRESIFNEVSICVFGSDRNTNASVFKDDGETIEVSYFNKELKKGDSVMPFTMETLEKEHPDILKEIQDKAVAAAQEQFNKEKEDLKTEMTDLEKANVELKKSNDTFSERLADLEKKDAIRQEQDIKALSENIFSALLSDSDIPERLYSKVKSQIDYNKFVKDNQLDKEAFSVAISEEVKDWTDKGITSSVLGNGVSSKSVDSINQMSSKDDEIVNQLLKMAGQKVS